MDKWFSSKWFVRIVSLAFAVLLFLFVSVDVNKDDTDSSLFWGKSDEVQTLNDVPVGIRLDNKDYVVSGVPEFVTVQLKGPAGALTRTVKQRNFDVFVDLEGLKEGDHVVEVEHGNISNDLTVFIEPKTIEVTIEERATKEFSVNVDFINEDKMAAGYELGDYELNTSTVTITSSRSVIDQIGVVKVFVDVTDLSEPINRREVPVNVYDTQGNELKVRVEPENVLVSAEVDNPSKKVPVNVSTKGELPEGYSLTSIAANVEEVEIFATSDVLTDLKEVKTEEIDLSKIKKPEKVEVGLTVPDGVTIPDGEKVEVSIGVEQTRTINDIPVDVENQEDEQSISFVEPESAKMSITVIGDAADVSKLSADDFRITVDVDSLVPGEHQVPVTIEGPDDIEIETTLEFENITVDIT